MAAAKAAEAESHGRPAARAAARRAGRHQGHHRRRGPADDLPFQDPRRQHRQGRRGLRAEAARRRRDRHGQAVDARIRDRRAELRPAVAAGAQSVEPRPSSRRLVVGLGRGRGRRACSRWRSAPTPAAACAIPASCLRHRRAEADLRPGVAPRRLSAVLHARPCRADDAHRRRQCADAAGDRRPRPARSRQRRRGDRPLCAPTSTAACAACASASCAISTRPTCRPIRRSTAALEQVARALQLEGAEVRDVRCRRSASSARSTASSCKARPGRSTVRGCASGRATTASWRAGA